MRPPLVAELQRQKRARARGAGRRIGRGWVPMMRVQTPPVQVVQAQVLPSVQVVQLNFYNTD